MKIAFLFAGQGSQYCGMGKDCYEQSAIFKTTMDSFDNSDELKHLCFEENDLLNQTQYAQMAIYAVSLSLASMLEDCGIHAEATCGLSLGEYSSYGYSKAMSLQDGLQLCKVRGTIMQNTLANTNSTMAAILTTDMALVEKACAMASDEGIVVIANLNSPDQVVISGERKAVEKAMSISLTLGARRAIELTVSGAFHSPLLSSAKDALKQALNNVSWSTPQIPVLSNLTGVEAKCIADSLLEQLVSPVHFQVSVEQLIDRGFDTFVEIGPKNTLSAFVRKISKNKNASVAIYNVEDMASFNKTKQALLGEENE